MSATPIIQHSAEWHEARTKCITATDISAILGLHPYKTPHEVYKEKLGLAFIQDPNDAMMTGTHLEHSIAEWFQSKTGKTIIRADFCTHKDEPIFGASPDYFIEGESAVLECKWCGMNAAKGFGDGADDVPAHYLLQVQWQLFVTGMQTGYLQVLGPWGFKAPYTIYADAELHKRMAFQARKFWGEYIVNSTPPPLTGKWADSEAIKQEFPQDDGSLVVASYELEETIEKLRAALDSQKDLETEVYALQNQIKQFMGEHATLESTTGKFHWKTTKERVETDWQALAMQLVESLKKQGVDLDLVSMAVTYSQTKPGYRRFTTPFRSEKA